MLNCIPLFFSVKIDMYANGYVYSFYIRTRHVVQCLRIEGDYAKPSRLYLPQLKIVKNCRTDDAIEQFYTVSLVPTRGPLRDG